MDHQINRILDAIEETGEMDNTLVIYLMGDTGASAEGSPRSPPHGVSPTNGRTIIPRLSPA